MSKAWSHYSFVEEKNVVLEKKQELWDNTQKANVPQEIEWRRVMLQKPPC